MPKIYQYVRDTDYFLVPIFRDFGDRPGGQRFVGVYLDEGEVKWGLRGTRDLTEDENYYKEVGEIDINGVILNAIRRAVEKGKEAGDAKDGADASD